MFYGQNGQEVGLSATCCPHMAVVSDHVCVTPPKSVTFELTCKVIGGMP